MHTHISVCIKGSIPALERVTHWLHVINRTTAYLRSHPTLLISLLVPLQAPFEGLPVQKGAEEMKSALSLLIGVLHR